MFLNTEKMEPPPGMHGDEVEEHLLGVVLAHQFLLKKGLKLFGEMAENATKVEIQQCVDMDCYQPLDEKRVDERGEKEGVTRSDVN